MAAGPKVGFYKHLQMQYRMKFDLLLCEQASLPAHAKWLKHIDARPLQLDFQAFHSFNPFWLPQLQGRRDLWLRQPQFPHDIGHSTPKFQYVSDMLVQCFHL